jgi:hypothetical protein
MPYNQRMEQCSKLNFLLPLLEGAEGVYLLENGSMLALASIVYRQRASLTTILHNMLVTFLKAPERHITFGLPMALVTSCLHKMSHFGAIKQSLLSTWKHEMQHTRWRLPSYIRTPLAHGIFACQRSWNFRFLS